MYFRKRFSPICQFELGNYDTLQLKLSYNLLQKNRRVKIIYGTVFTQKSISELTAAVW